MKFVQFIRDELLTKDPVVQFNFDTIEELTAHPYIVSFADHPNFERFSLHGFFLVAEYKDAEARLVGFIYGKDKHHLNLPVWTGILLEQPKMASCMSHIEIPPIWDQKGNATPISAAPVPDQPMLKWVTYWKDGNTRIIEGCNVSHAFDLAKLSKDDPDLDFYHIGDTPNYKWNNADRDWESKNSTWRG